MEAAFRSFEGQNELEADENNVNHFDHNVVSHHSIDKLLNNLRTNIIGGYELFETPFGNVPCIYADWTASGRALRNIEAYIYRNILPFYGNTHTSTSITGHQSTCFRHEARQIIAQAFNAKVTGKAADDVVLFTGNGTTGVNVPLPEKYRAEVSNTPIVFTSSYEHHSNLLPWRESYVDIVSVDYHPLTGVDLDHLRELLITYGNRRLKIGSFSAASNVTGILTAVDDISILLHQHGALAFFDYATAAPYVKLDMNAYHAAKEDGHLAYKDAVFFSGHKFLGGPGCPGVLIVKTRLLPYNDSKPTEPGGGTVFYVTEDHHRYLSNKEEREESGTPFILGDIKLGIVLHLRQKIGIHFIEAEEKRISEIAYSRLSKVLNLVILGRDIPKSENNQRGSHLPIFSFLIKRGSRFLHYNFVSALLNDLFGIQTRGGCQCAGPFSQQLLGISSASNKQLELALLDKHEVLRPGYSRFSLPYWMSPFEIDYILKSVEFIAQHGYKFLNVYRYNPKTGEWAHNSRITKFPGRKWISNFDFENDQVCDTDFSLSRSHQETLESYESLLDKTFQCAVQEVNNIDNLNNKKKNKGKLSSGKTVNLTSTSQPSSSSELGSSTHQDLRWFSLSEDAITTAKSEEIIGPLQPHLWGSTNHHSNKASLSTQITNDHAEQDDDDGLLDTGTTYANMRSNVKLCSHKVLNSSDKPEMLPRYLTQQLETKSTDKIDNPSNYSYKSSVTSKPNINGTSSKSHGDSDTKQIPLPQPLPQPLSQPLSQPLPQPLSLPITSLPPTDPSSSSSSSFSSSSSSSSPVCMIQRKSVPVDPNQLTEEKILSGTGTTYHPDHSLTSSGKIQIHTPPKKIMKLVGQAIKDWNMIEEGDRLLLGLSGGKDSLALLHILLAFQKRAPVKFTISCATVDPQTDSFDPSPLIPYVQSLGVTYHFLSEPIVALAKMKLQGDSLCAFCSRFKRGLLYSCCRTNKYNKLVLAQHLDDLAESFFMSALHNGQIRTMKANYKNDAGDLFVIRPLVYVRETTTRDFSVDSRLPIINENCPACFEQPKERHRIKKLLAQEEAMVPALFFNLRRAFLPLMDDDIYDSMESVVKKISENAKLPKSDSYKNKRNREDDDKNDSDSLLKKNKFIENSKDDKEDIGTKIDDVGKLNSDENSSEILACSKNGYCAPCYELC